MPEVRLCSSPVHNGWSCGLQWPKFSWDRPFVGWRSNVSPASFMTISLILTTDADVLRTVLQNLKPLIAFSSVILVEPMLSPNGALPLADLRQSLVKGACERKDVWSSKPHALKDLTSKARKAPWDRRALALYVEHGLKTHKGAKWEPPYMGVTLACTRDEEAVSVIHRSYSASFYQHFLELGNVQRCPVCINRLAQTSPSTHFFLHQRGERRTSLRSRSRMCR